MIKTFIKTSSLILSLGFVFANNSVHAEIDICGSTWYSNQVDNIDDKCVNLKCNQDTKHGKNTALISGNCNHEGNATNISPYSSVEAHGVYVSGNWTLNVCPPPQSPRRAEEAHDYLRFGNCTR